MSAGLPSSSKNTAVRRILNRLFGLITQWSLSCQMVFQTGVLVLEVKVPLISTKDNVTWLTIGALLTTYISMKFCVLENLWFFQVNGTRTVVIKTPKVHFGKNYPIMKLKCLWYGGSSILHLMLLNSRSVLDEFSNYGAVFCSQLQVVASSLWQI